MIIPFLVNNKTLIQDNEKDFIIEVFLEALKESEFSEDEKREKAQKYYKDNFENERWK